MKKLISKLGIAGQIFSGFGAVIAVAAIAGAIAVVSMFSFSASYHDYEDMANDALLASEINADMAKTLLNTREYLVTRSEHDLAATNRFLGEVKAGTELAREEIKKPYRAERIEKIAEDIHAYEAGLQRVIELYAERDRLVTTQLDVIGPQVRKGLTEIAQSAADDGDVQTAYDAALVQESLMLGRLYVAKFLLTNSESDLARVDAELLKAEAATTRLEESVENPSRREVLHEIVPQLEAYQAAAAAIGQVILERNQIRDETISVLGEEIGTMAAEIKASAVEDEVRIGEETQAEISSGETLTIIANGIAIVIAIGMAWLIGRGLSKPIQSMTDAMQRLAEGNHELEIPARDRGDEIGQMAAAVQVFKENAIEMKRLEAEQVENEKRATEEKTRAMNELADGFESSVKGVVDMVSSAATEMQATAQSMSATAEQTSQQSTAAAAASDQATNNVQTVASAAEELSASISEISGQVQHSSQIASGAAEQAQKTTDQVSGLVEAANRIGEVVKLISDIAEQTNLLALNATIEAARAGEAGKGFAVVASEVKSLATQTAKATEEISSQIGGIQSATTESAKAITEIATTIGEINQIASGVAAAVEEQGAATQEISRNVQEAASGTQEVNSNIAGVTQAATQTGTSANEVLQAAGELSQQSEVLRTEVDSFIQKVRAA